MTTTLAPQSVSRTLVKAFPRSKSYTTAVPGWHNITVGFRARRNNDYSVSVNWHGGRSATYEETYVKLVQLRDHLVEQGYKIVQEPNPTLPGYGFIVGRD